MTQSDFGIAEHVRMYPAAIWSASRNEHPDASTSPLSTFPAHDEQPPARHAYGSSCSSVSSSSSVASRMKVSGGFSYTTSSPLSVFSVTVNVALFGSAGGAAAAGGAVLFPSFAAANRSNDKFDGGFTRDGFEAARAYEAAERWRERLSDDDLAFINGELDAGLMAYFGFDFVNGSSASARRPPRRHASVQLALLPTAAAPRLDAAEHRRLLSFLS